MTLRRLGERMVFPIGLALLPAPGSDLVQPRDEMFDTVIAGLDAGVALIDVGCLVSGADAPDPSGIVAEALDAWDASVSSKDRVVVAGHVPLADPSQDADVLARSAADAAEAAARRLGRPLGLCFVDVRAGTTEASLLPVLERLATDAAVEAVGIGDLDRHLADQLLCDDLVRGPAIAVQNQFGSRFEHDADLIDRCASGHLAYLPRVTVAMSEEVHDPGSPFESLSAIAEQRSLSVSQLTLTWLLARGEVVVPVVACAHAAEIEAAVHAADIELTADELAQLSAAIPRSLAVFDGIASA